jgi:hypothetical protein
MNFPLFLPALAQLRRFARETQTQVGGIATTQTIELSNRK